MKIKLLSIFSALLIALPLVANQSVGSRVSALKVDRSTDRLLVNMVIDADGLGKKTNSESWFTPVLTDTAADGTVNTLRLPSVFVGGHSRYYLAMRRGEQVPLYRGGKIDYAANVEWQPWMETATLSLEQRDCGCCGEPKALLSDTLITFDFVPRTFKPTFHYIRPEADSIKVRTLEGRAFIDFPVNRTEIYPDYRSNPRELAAIRATIDSVRLDPDVTVKTMTFKGFASPEGSYKNNVRLAQGRTESLKKYVQNLYNFNPNVIQTSFEPEDWEGLLKFVEGSNLDNRQAILDIINSDLAPDAKDNKIRSAFPEQYDFLLKNVYPALRHTDYTINYIIRSYSDPKEMVKLVYSRPQNLSLNEFFLAAMSVPQGSPTYNYIFETAARMYPDSEVANLNAANAAMQQGALDNAATFLAKAGDTPEAINARAILTALRGDYQKAIDIFRQAAKLKVATAPDDIRQLEEIIKHNNRVNGVILTPENSEN